jgi:hypothetical protein
MFKSLKKTHWLFVDIPSDSQRLNVKMKEWGQELQETCQKKFKEVPVVKFVDDDQARGCLMFFQKELDPNKISGEFLLKGEKWVTNLYALETLCDPEDHYWMSLEDTTFKWSDKSEFNLRKQTLISEIVNRRQCLARYREQATLNRKRRHFEVELSKNLFHFTLTVF